MTHAGFFILGLTYILITTLAGPALMWAGVILLITVARKINKAIDKYDR